MSEFARADIETAKIPKRILNSIIQSLSAGVVPRSGAPYIAIGRQGELAALLSDLENVADGGASIRFLIGRYGSGKSFLIQLLRGYALERDFITADCDLSPERRLYGTGGAGVATYRELIRNLASKAAPDGGALAGILARRLSELQAQAAAEGVLPSSPDFELKINEKIYASIKELQLAVGGFDFSLVISEYLRAALSGEDNRVAACLRWLRGEYASKTEARAALGFSVSTIVDDDNWYDFIKLWAAFARTAGYRGLVVFVDECVNLYKITNRVSRENNYEKLLSMFNDALGARAPGLALIFGGTPQFLEDTRRGLFGYEALRSRLADSRFADARFNSFTGPIIRLRRLSDDELLALISRLTRLYSAQSGSAARVGDGEMIKFLSVCTARAGAGELITPREIIRDYLYVLDAMAQNPEIPFDEIVGGIKAEGDENPDGEGEGGGAHASPEDIEI